MPSNGGFTPILLHHGLAAARPMTAADVLISSTIFVSPVRQRRAAG
jgi:hypothetical protein